MSTEEGLQDGDTVEQRLAQLPGRLTDVANRFIDKTGGTVNVGRHVVDMCGDYSEEEKLSGIFTASKHTDEETGVTAYEIYVSGRKRPFAISPTTINTNSYTISWTDGGDNGVELKFIRDKYPNFLMLTLPELTGIYEKSASSQDPETREGLLRVAETIIAELDNISDATDDDHRNRMAMAAIKKSIC